MSTFLKNYIVRQETTILQISALTSGKMVIKNSLLIITLILTLNQSEKIKIFSKNGSRYVSNQSYIYSIFIINLFFETSKELISNLIFLLFKNILGA